MLGAGGLALAAAHAVGGAAALFHIVFIACPAVFPAEHGVGVQGGEQGGDVDLHGAAVGAVAAGGAGHQIHAVKHAPHLLDGGVFLFVQGPEIFHEAEVIRHLLLCTHTGEHHHHALLGGGVADGIGGVAAALQAVQHRFGLVRQIHQVPALHRLHDDDRLIVLAADLQTRHAPDHRAVCVQIVKLDLYRLNTGLLGENAIQHFGGVVEGHADVLYLSLRFQLLGDCKGPAAEILVISLPTHGVHQVKVKILHPAGLKLGGKEGADVLLILKKGEGQLVRQHKALPGVAGSEALPQRRLALSAQIGAGRVKIIKAPGHKHVHHFGESGNIHCILQHGQSHAAETEVFPNFREEVVHCKNLRVS